MTWKELVRSATSISGERLLSLTGEKGMCDGPVN